MGTSEINDEQLLLGIAQKAQSLRLEAPLLFMIEAHLPLSTLIHTLGLMLQPVAAPLLGASRMQRLLGLLAERENLERLAKLLEDERDAAQNKSKLHKAGVPQDS